jgi:predicted LPLAT superfamily acyltransferase
MKEGRRKYKVLLERLPEPEGETRQERVQFLADAYASALEAVVRQYPDQWYNFYDFWK